MIGTYKKMFQALVPANIEKFAAEKGSFLDGLKVFMLAWVVAIVIGLIARFAVYLMRGTAMADIVGGVGIGLVVSVILLAFQLPVYVAAYYVGEMFAIKYFKGKGAMGQLFSSAMLFIGSMMIIESVIGALMLPFLSGSGVAALSNLCIVGAISGIVVLALWIYRLYLLFLAAKAAHGLASTEAVLTIIVIVVVHFVLRLLLELLIVGIVLAFAAGVMGVASLSQAGGLTNMVSI